MAYPQLRNTALALGLMSAIPAGVGAQTHSAERLTTNAIGSWAGLSPAESAAAPEPSTPVLSAPISNYRRANHDALVNAVRAQRTDAREAAHQIAQWLAQPLAPATRQRLWSDGVVFAQQAGQPRRALAWASESGTSRLATYALADVYRAARTTGDRRWQGEAVQALLARSPDDWQARIWHALWLVDSAQYPQAEHALARLSTLPAARSPAAQVQWLEVLGAMQEARNENMAALDTYTRIKAIDPQHRYARRESAFLLGELGGPAAAYAYANANAHAHANANAEANANANANVSAEAKAEAQAQAQAQPQNAQSTESELFDDVERASLHQQSLGQRLQWTLVARDQLNESGAARHAALDALIADLDAAIAAVPEARRQDSAWRPIWLNLEYDRLTAWQERGRARQVVDRYHALREAGAVLPYYALSAVAGALQQLRRSDLAVPLYEAALREGGSAIPIPSDTHVGLVYAYMDTGRFGQAEQLLQEMERATPPQLSLSPLPEQPNPQYSEVRHLRALLQLYTNHTAQAERSFQALVSMAPMNSAFRGGQAETARLREQPDASLALYQETLTDHPDDVATRADHANALIGVNDIAQARREIDTLSIDAPDSIAVRNARRELRAIDVPRLDVDAGAARDGGALANREWRLDTRLTSGLINDTWRIYARQVLARAELDDGRERFARSGLGAQWSKDRWAVSGEVHRANSGRYRTGIAGEVSYRASDRWRLSAGFDTNSVDTPYKARRAEIGAHDARLQAQYIVNESRSYALGYQRMDFSDGNARNTVEASWRERWIAGPRFIFETTVGADTSSNSRQDTPYFSPSNGTSASITTRSQWLTWKRDDRQFFQVIEAGAGGYRQSGFGTGALWSLRYAHEWTVGRSFSLQYGVGLSSHPYDGDHEKRRDVFLLLSMPLQ